MQFQAFAVFYVLYCITNFDINQRFFKIMIFLYFLLFFASVYSSFSLSFEKRLRIYYSFIYYFRFCFFFSPRFFFALSDIYLFNALKRYLFFCFLSFLGSMFHGFGIFFPKIALSFVQIFLFSSNFNQQMI